MSTLLSLRHQIIVNIVLRFPLTSLQLVIVTSLNIKLKTPEYALLRHYSFQELYRAFLPALLLRHQGKAEGRFHLRPLPERRPPHLGRPGLRQELRHPFLFHLTTSRSHVHLAQVPARLAHNNTQTTPCRTNNLKRRQIIIPMYT